MKLKYDGKMYACSFAFALDMVSGKWKGLILWYLRDETLRYGEIRKKLDGITQKMLTQTLRDLEKHQLISRKVYAVVPPKVEYTISDHGKKLIPIFEQMLEWGDDVGSKLGEVFVCDEEENRA